ncbi:WSC-domain-containing protein [Mytilinidion resinicola]|uniref:WSC-domain-containing protein n=1 Tax=Mytilinidion resinicola TaxID=574789 RepID=A0A6A6YB64_9PEZI|nr:WSC-domain-containing protein [Mytilinidion resinicola]KAF2805077.1 WSC-domain-containing protein [Mytilinidion resinicola]
MSCPGRLVRERLDPIVFPDAVSAHVHTIFGGSGFGASMDYAQARSSDCSSCEIKEDLSNYWTPQLYVHAKNGFFLPVPIVNYGSDNTSGGMAVYYLQRHENSQAFPEGFRMIAGDSFKRNMTGGLNAKAITYSCYGTKFEDEWDGNKQPFVLSNGDAAGYGMHGDFVNGWDVDVLQNAATHCNANSGKISDCAYLTTYTIAKNHACRLPPIVDVVVDGWVDALPGYNPVTYGPEPAKPIPCAQKALSPPKQEFVDLTNSKRWEYVGCGVDNYFTRTFTGKTTAGDDMTVEKCVDFCNAAGFSYAGLEYRRECYCDNTLPEDKAPKQGIMGYCILQCAGNSKEFCGGGAALSIYRKCTAAACQNAVFDVAALNRTAPTPIVGGSIASRVPSS